MEEPKEVDIEQETAMQLIRAGIRTRSLSRLKDAFDRPWAQKVIYKYQDASPPALYRLFKAALSGMKEEERKRAFQWTWDCYHPYMSDLGKALEDLDGYVKGQHL